MNQPTKNPWIIAGAVAGLSVAAALALAWPSPTRAPEKPHAVVRQEPAQKDACRACQEARCELTLDACYPPGEGKRITWPPPDAGGPPTPEEQAGCRETYECFRQTHCADLDPGVCYCGDGVDGTKCFAGEATANGTCKELVERNAKTKDAKAIGLRYSDPSYPLGLANMLRQCDLAFCKAACK